jgi:GT2 family glycosyltransferase
MPALAHDAAKRRTRGVTVVIPTVDREQSLERALGAVAHAARHLDEPVEAIVVDDRPASDTTERPAAWSVDGLSVRRLRTASAAAKGPAAARNLGVAHAAHDLIAFTDDDARCDQWWLSVAVATLRADPSLAGVEGAVHLDEAHPVDPVRSRLVVNLTGGAYLTASLFARAAAVEAVGGFRRLRTDGDRWALPYREDSDLALRLIAHVGPVPFLPAAFVLHPAEAIDLRRLVSLAGYFVVDGAYLRLHPAAERPLWRRPLARLRIRLATAEALLLGGLAPRRTRCVTAIGLLGIGLALSLQFELELRAAGRRRALRAAAPDVLRRLPRSLLWGGVAGAARVRGELAVRLGFARLPGDAGTP